MTTQIPNKKQNTIFDSKIILPILSWLSSLILFVFRWKVAGEIPKEKKYIIIVAPHTSNWDFFWGMCTVLKMRWRVNWVGKDSLFTGFKGGIMRWLGGTGIDRSNASNIVDSYIQLVEKSESINIVITPEGTRGYVDKWKTGFYRIADGADIPLALAFIDFSKKELGFGPMMKTTGDYEQDKAKIKAFYRPIIGKNPESYCVDFD
ncbi:1-acyl-sn-glycerol-3-phosphate acyltransferase [Marinicellulosiphila megalodicopiae]|uniref:1-acyl-sn-glycerol-3-phosphate acyltransferase n=1 Tax=Marinicellulosiphila megalodicopiae TaxID=2724896 RepID=UPI003BB10EAA